MFPHRPPPIVRLSISAPDGGPPRQHPRQPHPASIVEAVRGLVEGTRLPYRVIDARTGVNHGTISRWAAAKGWKRPPGAWPRAPRTDGRYVPVLIGRALATRLRLQAERLLLQVESAPEVDPAKLAEALGLLAQARAEQKMRRGRRLQPPPPPDPAAGAPKKKPRRQHDRHEAALLGWTRRSRREQYHQWMLQKIDG